MSTQKDDPNMVMDAPVIATAVGTTTAQVPSSMNTATIQVLNDTVTKPSDNATTSNAKLQVPAQPSVTSMVTISTPGNTPTAAPTSSMLDEGPTCARYDDMVPDCAKIFSCDDLECGLCFEGGCVEKSAVVESFDCIDKDNQEKRSTMTYVVMLPFLPLALAYLLLKWVFCNLGPCLVIPFIIQTLFVILANIARGVVQKTAMVFSWICTYVIYLPFAMGYHQVVIPTITWICENVVTPICTLLCTFVTFLCDHVFVPIYVGFTTCLQFFWDGIVWVFSKIADAITWIYESLLTPCCIAISNCFVAVWNSMTTCISSCATLIHTYILVPMNNCLSYIATSIWACLTSIGNFIYTYIWLSLVRCYSSVVEYVFTPIYNAFIACCQAFGRCLSAVWTTVFVPIGNAFYMCVEAVFTCIFAGFNMIWDYVFVPIGNVIVFILTGIGNIFNAIFNAISACMGAIFENVIVPIGNAIGIVLSAIGSVIGAFLSAIGNFLAAIWSAFTSILP